MIISYFRQIGEVIEFYDPRIEEIESHVESTY